MSKVPMCFQLSIFKKSNYFSNFFSNNILNYFSNLFLNYFRMQKSKPFFRLPNSSLLIFLKTFSYSFYFIENQLRKDNNYFFEKCFILLFEESFPLFFDFYS